MGGDCGCVFMGRQLSITEMKGLRIVDFATYCGHACWSRERKVCGREISHVANLDQTLGLENSWWRM